MRQRLRFRNPERSAIFRETFCVDRTFRQFDLIVNRKFPFAETRNVEFRAEIFNIFNLANFAAPPSTLGPALGTSTSSGQFQPGQPLSTAGSSAFGIVTSTVERSVGLGTNRQIQFALRVNF